MHLITAGANIVRNALINTELLDRTRRAFEAMTKASDRARIVNQAVGVLIRANCTEDQARWRLERMASHSNEDLAAAAGSIVDEARKEAHLSYIAAGRPSRTCSRAGSAR